MVEFATLARIYLGPGGSWLSVFASVGMLWGATLAYCILMSGFLFNVGDTVAYWINGVGRSLAADDVARRALLTGMDTTPEALPPESAGIEITPLAPYWTPDYVAIGIMLAILPLTMVKSFGFFARMGAVGTAPLRRTP